MVRKICRFRFTYFQLGLPFYLHAKFSCLFQVYLLRKVLEQKANNINRVYSLITDHFDLCLTKCRTSSESVRHENSYIDSQLKYCYGSSGDMNVEQPPSPVNKTRPLISRIHSQKNYIIDNSLILNYIINLLELRLNNSGISVFERSPRTVNIINIMGPRSTPPLIQSKVDTTFHPYNVPWLNSCYQETLLPGKSVIIHVVARWGLPVILVKYFWKLQYRPIPMERLQ